MGEMTRDERNEILQRHGLYRSVFGQGGVSLDAWAVARRLAAMERVVRAIRRLPLEREQWLRHHHVVPGVWDVSNGPPTGGTPCEKCAANAEVFTALAALDEGGE